jgi:hypothetical protein
MTPGLIVCSADIRDSKLLTKRIETGTDSGSGGKGAEGRAWEVAEEKGLRWTSENVDSMSHSPGYVIRRSVRAQPDSRQQLHPEALFVRRARHKEARFILLGL